MTQWIVPLVNIAFIALMLSYAVRLIGRARRSRSWPTVQATVIDARVRSGKTSAPLIEYEYVIEGRRYTSRRRAVGMALSVSGDWAAKIVAASPKGSTVVASVDPGDPAYAVLVPGISGAHLLLIVIVGGITIGSGLSALLFGPV